MKLDFNYDGKTKLKDWWGKIKANFQTVQDGFNNLDSKVDKEIYDRQAADNVLQDNIDTETSKRQSADNLLQQNINKEIADRQQQDGNLQSQINKINETSGREALFGKHKIQFVTDLGIPVVQFEGEQMYHGDEITVKIGDYNMSFYIDGVHKSSGRNADMSIPANGTSYIVVKYDFELEDISVSVSETYVESTIENGRWQFTAYEYSNFNYDLKVDSESPTGDRYELLSYSKNYGSENVSLDTYTVEYKYGTSDRTLEDLQTNNKDSFLDAVNEIAVTLSPINHRNIFRGKNLGSAVTEAQKTAIQSGTFDDLFVGDYWEIDGTKWRIVDMDYWLNTGLPNAVLTKHHLVIMPDKALYNYAMDETGSAENGYSGSTLYISGMETAKTIISNIFSDMIITHKEQLVSGITEDGNAKITLTDSDIEIPDEIMLYGTRIASYKTQGTYSKTQLKLFDIAAEYISTRETYWLRDVASTTDFCAVLATGNTGTQYAGSSLGIRPVFAIG